MAELESDDRDARESARESAAQAKEKEAALREQRKRLDKARRAAEEKEAALEEAVKAEAEAETRRGGGRESQCLRARLSAGLTAGCAEAFRPHGRA